MDNCRQCHEAMIHLDDSEVKYDVKKITDPGERKALRTTYHTTTFPILVLDDGSSHAGIKEIRRWLFSLSESFFADDF
jgi:glutaredoxin